MPATPLTDDQQRARDTRDVSIGVSAGAGCGKTHVLTSRFLAHLDPSGGGDELVDLRQLIAITFTDAAAREMRSRIRQACYEKLDDRELSDEDRATWQRLLREIDGARVSTIHSFCTALLRSNAADAGLDPMFGVLEQGEADVLLQEAVDTVVRDRLASHDADVLDLAAEFGQLAQLKERVLILVGQRHRPVFSRWLADASTMTAKAEELIANWRERYNRDAVGFALRKISEKAPIDELLRLLAIATPTPSSKRFPAAIATLRDLLTRLQANPEDLTLADAAAIDENARIQTICKKDDWPSPDDFAAYKAACEKMRSAIKNSTPPPWDDAAARAAAIIGLKTLRLAGDVAAEYESRKLQSNKLDFDDQLALAHKLLSDPEKSAIRDALSADLRLLLVDEFQDTDPLQVDLIKRVCGAGFDEGRLFFVGDFKQSIYRFRGAVPPEFLKLRSEVPDSGRLKLTTNFRSQPGVLHFVNALFHDTFDNYEALDAKREAATSAPAVEFLWTIAGPEITKGQGGIEAARRLEAAAIAQRLRQLMDDECAETPVCDKVTKQARRLRPGDVAILFRALSDVRLYEEALREQGLEYYLVGGHAFYAQQEIFDILNLLRAVGSTADEVSLAGTLRSPFFSFADETLFWLVEHSGTLNSGLFAAELPVEISPEERAKVRAAARVLSRLRSMKDIAPTAQILNESLELTGYDAVVLAEFMGERKLANVYKLIEQARTADANGNDFNEFITQLAEFIAQPPKEPLASTSAESADVIRLMTIHRAKGLEFPFVVVPDLDRPLRPFNSPAALDDDLGPLVRVSSDDDHDEAATGITLYDAQEYAAELDERKRLLYVATTRAADYLLLSSSMESLEKPKGDWMKLLGQHFNLTNGEFIGVLPSNYEPPRVHIASPPAEPFKLAGRARGADLVKALDEAHEIVAEGTAIIPEGVAPIRLDPTARRQFSFSRLTGKLVRPRVTMNDNEGDTPFAPGSAEDAEDYDDNAGLPISRVASGASTATPLLDARALGSLTHDVLNRIDLAAAGCAAEIAGWCDHLAPQYVTEDAAMVAHAAAAMIERFVDSPCGRHLAAATTLHREIEFLLAWPPAESKSAEPATRSERQQNTSDAPAGKYIQGFIDCLYQDSTGAWRIVDYKTNDVTSAEIDYITKRYEMQLYVYAMAAERSLGVVPTELVLTLLRPGIELVIPWNDRARDRAIQMVNEAIESATNDLESLSPQSPGP